MKYMAKLCLYNKLSYWSASNMEESSKDLRILTCPSPILKNRDGTYVHEKFDAANRLAESFASVSDGRYYSEQFKRHKMVREQQQVNFNSNQDISYNESFSETELNLGLHLTSEISPGPEKITYSTIKHSHPSMIALILNILNKIFSEEKFHSNWRTSTTVAFPKLCKDIFDPIN